MPTPATPPPGPAPSAPSEVAVSTPTNAPTMLPLALPRSRLERLKDIAATVQSVTTVLGLLAALVWFFQQGRFFPHADVTVSLTHRPLTSDWTWVHCAVSVSNVGYRSLHVTQARVWLEKILPLERSLRDRLDSGEHIIATGESVVPWPAVDSIQERPVDVVLEPGEHQVLEFEFLVTPEIQTVKAYSHLAQAANESYGWDNVTIYDVHAVEKERH